LNAGYDCQHLANTRLCFKILSCFCTSINGKHVYAKLVAIGGFWWILSYISMPAVIRFGKSGQGSKGSELESLSGLFAVFCLN